MWILAFIVLVVVLVWPTGGPRQRGRAVFRHTGPQWRRNYGRRSFIRYGLALGTAAVLVYTGADTAFEQRHTAVFDPREGRLENAREVLRAEGKNDEADALPIENFPNGIGDGAARTIKPTGDRGWFLVWGLTAASDWLWRSTSATRWGRANFEAMCVGLPMLWTTQRVLGSNRPSSRDGSPHWRPFEHANAASGHAFMGAIPWWNLARRLNPVLARGAAGALGMVAGWSRLNDRKHYLSQVILGWTIAYNAVDAVGEYRVPAPTGEEG